MTIIMSNFNFLRENNFYLYSLAKDAERNLYIDNDTSLYKLRKIIEEIIKDIYIKENLENQYAKNLYTNINYLYNNGYISWLMFKNMTIVREEGNYTVHNNIYLLDEINIKVIKSLKATYMVCAYYVKLYFNVDKIESFKDYYQKSDNNLFQVEFNKLSLENEFFYNMLNKFVNEVSDYINKKAIFDNNFKVINKIDFDIFFQCYLETLNYIIVKDEDIINDIIRFKNICKKKINSSNGNDVNIYISKLLYENIYN